MRGRRERSRVEELEDQVIIQRLWARGLWTALRKRSGVPASDLVDAVFASNTDGLRIADPVFDASEAIYDAQRITVLPCRQVLDPPARGLPLDWPTQDEMYVATWPDGSTRNLTRDQVLMMAGMDPAQVGGEQPVVEAEVPF